MEKHSVTVATALTIVTKILAGSLGRHGSVTTLGCMVVAEYRDGNAQVTTQVTFQPEPAFDISGSAASDSIALESLLERAENTKELIMSTFELIQVRGLKQVAWAAK